MGSRSAHSVLHHAYLHHREARPQALQTGSQIVNKPPTLIERASNPSHTCGADKNSACTLPTDTGNITIALAAGIPITVAIIVLFFLHRRIKRKMRHEDKHDKHKSLDFGLDEVNHQASKKKRKGKPEMALNTAPSSRRERGMSLDMDYPTPYILPAGVHGSRDSLHSMSRGLSDPNDPYRPVTFASDHESLRSPSALRNENGSIYTTGGYSERSGSMTHKASLLRNAARMPYAGPQNASEEKYTPPTGRTSPTKPLPPRKQSLATGKADRWYPADDTKYGSESPQDLSNVPAHTPLDILSEKSSIPAFPEPARYEQRSPVVEYDEKRPFLSEHNENFHPQADALRITVPSPAHSRQSPPRSPGPLPALPGQAEQNLEPSHQQQNQGYEQHERDDQKRHENPLPPVPKHNSDPHDALALPGHDMRRVSVMGMRPLPLEDPRDDPEQRANRIRSFYREYFDDSKPNPVGHYPEPMPAPYDPYGYGAEDEYHADFLDDGAIYDPDTGAFYTNPQAQQMPHQPYAVPMDRRAMTPPPRGPGHFMRGHRSAMSTQSAGRRPPMMQQKKKNLPPPKPLQSLPTPHLLRDDTSILLDFAPPSTFREQQNGRAPDSRLGTPRPYSPAFRAHTPLGNSFDDLAVMPSPHALRQSGTFTALDFAPPPRFRDRADSASDAGSIRSNRSGLSAVQRNAIRNGAYRISRLPATEVGTQKDIQQSLRPKWDIGR